MGAGFLMRISAITLLWILFGTGLLTAEQAPTVPPEKAEPATIKTSSRFVVLDVLVTGKLGQPVHGLKPQDFLVLEDGKPQQVRGFEERGPNLAPPHPAPVLNLPPDTYTNYVSVQPPGATNILLFDMLNTDRQGLAMERQQLLLYLSKMPANTQVALYTLDSAVHLVHGFTDDPSQLIALAKHLSNKPHPMFSQARDVSVSIAMAKELIMDPVLLSHTIQFLWSEQQGKEESRTLITMQALEQLARSVAVVPGRKNLVWISGGIPFDTASTAPEMRHLASVLAATQTAVYPVDVRGIPYLGADASAYDKEAFGGGPI